jgi:hypothetical protein
VSLAADRTCPCINARLGINGLIKRESMKFKDFTIGLPLYRISAAGNEYFVFTVQYFIYPELREEIDQMQ